MKTVSLGIVIGASVAGAVRGINLIVSKTTALNKKLSNLSGKKIEPFKIDRYKRGIENITATIDKIEKEKKSLSNKILDTSNIKEQRRLNQELEKIQRKLYSLKTTKLKLEDKFQRAKASIDKTNKSLYTLNRSLESIKKSRNNLDNIYKKREEFRSKALDTVALGATVVIPVKSAIKFESAMADVKKVANLNDEEVKKFGNEIVKLSTKIPITAEGLAQIAAAGGQLGIEKNKLIDFTKVVAKMSTAFDMSANDAGESIAKMMNIYGLQIGGVTKLGDVINHLSDNTAAKARDIVNVLARTGGTAKMFGLAPKNVAALADAFLALGKPPEVAAGAINSLLTKLNTADKQGKKFNKGLKDIGLSARGLKKMIKDNPQKALDVFFSKLKRFDKQKQMGILTNMFGAEWSDDLALLLAGYDNYKKALKLVGDEQGYANSMQKEFENRAATTENKLHLLSNTMKSIGITIGNLFLPAIGQGTQKLQQWGDRLNSFLGNHKEEVKLWGGIAGGIIATSVSLSILGYGMSFVMAGLHKLGLAFKFLLLPIKKSSQLIHGFGNSLKKVGSSACGMNGCLIGSESNMARLSKKAMLLTGVITALGIAFVTTNSAIANSAKQDIDSKRVMGKNISKLKEQEQYLKKRIKEAKEGGVLESFLYGSNNKAKITTLQKRLKMTQNAIKKTQSPQIQPLQKSPEEIIKGYQASILNLKRLQKTAKTPEQKDAFNRAIKVLQTKIENIKTKDISSILDKGLKDREFAKLRPITNSFIQERPKYTYQDYILEQNKTIKNDITPEKSTKPQAQKINNNDQTIQQTTATVQALQTQYQTLQATVQTIANRPQQYNYHVSVVVNNAKSDQDVEGAVKRALAQAKYENSQRSMNDL